MPNPSTPSLTATSLTLTARRLRRLCPSHPFRLAPLAVGTAVPLPRRRRGLRPPLASASPPAPMSAPPPAPLPTPPVAGAPSTLPSPTRRHGPAPHPSTPSLTAISPHPHGSPPSAPLPLSPLPPRSARRRRPRPTSASPVRASPASGFRIPPLLRCPHHRQRYYRRFRSLALPPHFLPQQGGMVHAQSFNPIPPCYIPRPHGSPPSAPLPLSTPPPRSARRRHRRPASASPARASPASGFRIPPLLRCPHHCGRHCPRLRSLALPPHSLPQQGAIVHAHSFNTIPPCYIPHPHGSPPSAPLPPSTLPPRYARRRLRRPASASPVRASPASGFRIPPAPLSTPPRAPLPSPSVAGTPCTLPSPTRRHRPCPLLQHHPSLLHPPPSRLAAFGAFAALNPSASLRSPSAPPSRIRVAGAGFARLRLPHPPPAPVSAPPRAPLPTPPVAGAPSALPSPTRRHRPCPLLQHHPSLLHPPPSRLAAFGAFAPLNPSASLRSPSAPPSRFHAAGAGFARLRLPHTPLLRCPHHRQRHYRRLRSLALPPHSLPQQAAWSGPHPSTPSLPATSPHPHGSPSAPPSRIRAAGAGFARLRLPHPPLLRYPHHRERHYPHLRSLALPPHSLPQQGGMVRASSFNTIPPCYIPSPARLAAFGAFAALNPSASLRSPSAPPSHIHVAGAGFARLRLPHPPLLRCPHHRQRHCRRLRQRALHDCRQLLRQ